MPYTLYIRSGSSHLVLDIVGRLLAGGGNFTMVSILQHLMDRQL